jgi:hypothetical protein
MINDGDAMDAIIEALQAIPDLVSLVGGAQNIIGYDPTFPGSMYFIKDLDQLLPGQILVRWLATDPGNKGENRYWKHTFGIYMKPPDTTQAPTRAARYMFQILLTKGVPLLPSNPNGARLTDYQVVPGCDLMDIPHFKPWTDATQKLDYLLATFVFPEIGDN